MFRRFIGKIKVVLDWFSKLANLTREPSTTFYFDTHPQCVTRSMSNRMLDCTHLSCPLPIVEITRTVREMAEGEILEVHAKDRAFKSDVEAWSRRTGHTVEEFRDGETQIALIRV